MIAPATIHGVRALPLAPVSDAAPAVAPTGAPQRWQKRAWAESSAWQWAQLRGPAGAPQLLQKRPVTAAPQLPHVAG
jgi:hypothetical protein